VADLSKDGAIIGGVRDFVIVDQRHNGTPMPAGHPGSSGTDQTRIESGNDFS
jgi:hypothetical protein